MPIVLDAGMQYLAKRARNRNNPLVVSELRASGEFVRLPIPDPCCRVMTITMLPTERNYIKARIKSLKQQDRMETPDMEAAEWVNREINDPLVEVDPVTVSRCRSETECLITKDVESHVQVPIPVAKKFANITSIVQNMSVFSVFPNLPGKAAAYGINGILVGLFGVALFLSAATAAAFRVYRFRAKTGDLQTLNEEKRNNEEGEGQRLKAVQKLGNHIKEPLLNNVSAADFLRNSRAMLDQQFIDPLFSGSSTSTTIAEGSHAMETAPVDLGTLNPRNESEGLDLVHNPTESIVFHDSHVFTANKEHPYQALFKSFLPQPSQVKNKSLTPEAGKPPKSVFKSIVAEKENGKAQRKGTIEAFRAAAPAMTVGAGALSVFLAGVDGALQLVGLVATASFITYDLLWADTRGQFLQELKKITDHEKLSQFLKKRNIVT